MDASGEKTNMILIPIGTQIYEPDPINRVTLQFPDQDSAIIFFELIRSMHNGAHLERQ